MILGILQTGHASDEIRQTHGDFDSMFRRLLDGHGFDFRVFNVVDMEFPDGPAAADAWLVTGSKHGAYEDHPWIPPLEELIRAIRAAERPMVGICFGHQVIAQALGGRVEKFAGGWSVGRQSYRIGGKTFHLNAWHQDQVVDLPAGAEVLGQSDFCANAVLAYGPRILTVQPHPEFDAAIMAGLITHRGPGIVPEDQLTQAAADLPQPNDAADIALMLAEVLKKARVDA
ncbi:type 1 glutamine amidotransferase [Rhodophyticola porphyridii]|uniref:Type 1 glutamine amidotransferase n=1 Tax=Rhodophyticola porphyridii TaxID=1852017 RepID=A0A3L9YDA2_9RHOB|nr:type 1 glutamine amidotransferase [Rhodophyticola porphyridii]RMA40940.1 type 1 glutamine amidotransferase [Rhodophyticola porphyridii]